MTPSVIQPETWKAIGDYSGKVWTAVGPLLGVLIGAWLGRAWDSKKWQQENRKEECRELLTSISHAATIRVTVGRGHSEREAYDAYLDSLRIFHDRLFIAADLKKAQLLDVWAHAVNDLLTNKIDSGIFSDRVSGIQNTIIGFVVPKVGKRFSALRAVKRILWGGPTEPPKPPTPTPPSGSSVESVR